MPVGVGGKGNSGVAATIKNQPGAIGYLNYGYVVNSDFQQVALQNKAGNYVKASAETSAAGLSQIVLDDQLRGADANLLVPMRTLLSPLLGSLPIQSPLPKSVKETLRYMLSEKSQAKSDALGYVPLPEDLRQKPLAAVDSIN